jgi:hypothetical protein
MKSTLRLILVTSLVMAAHTSTYALTSDSVRCSGGLISVGDMAPDVLNKCGQPAYATQREEKVVTENFVTGDRLITTVVVDDWTFNFGPDRFQYRLILKNNKVWQIESLDYGY